MSGQAFHWQLIMALVAMISTDFILDEYFWDEGSMLLFLVLNHVSTSSFIVYPIVCVNAGEGVKVKMDTDGN